VKKRSKDHAERERRADRAGAGLVPADAREARGPSAEAARAVNPPSPRPRQAEAAFRKEPPTRTATPGLMRSSHHRLCCNGTYF